MGLGIDVITGINTMNISLWLPSDPEQFKDVDNWEVFLEERIEKLTKDKENSQTIFNKAMLLLLRLIQEYPSSVSSLRIGSETCIRKEVDLPILEAFSRIAQNTQMQLNVVLPPLAESELHELNLSAFLKQHSLYTSIVVNDLGVLSKVYEEFPRDIIAGRLLWKRKRSSRLSPEELDLISQYELSEWCEIAYPEWINCFNVKLLEIDLLPQGTLYSTERPYAIHMPWTFISYGRICYIGSLELDSLEKFKIMSSCNKECLKIQHVLDDKSYPIPLLRSGKGVYCLSDPKDYSWIQNKSLSNIIVDLRRSPG